MTHTLTFQDLTCQDCGKDYQAVDPQTMPQCRICTFVYVSLNHREW